MEEYLYKELSYKVVGLCMEIHREYGSIHNERIYHKALEEKLLREKIKFSSKPKITIYSVDTGNKIGFYEPDLVVEEKMVIELKATSVSLTQFEIQLLGYLKVSAFEIGYLFNFGQPSLYFKRLISTSNKKIFCA